MFLSVYNSILLLLMRSSQVLTTSLLELPTLQIMGPRHLKLLFTSFTVSPFILILVDLCSGKFTSVFLFVYVNFHSIRSWHVLKSCGQALKLPYVTTYKNSTDDNCVYCFTDVNDVGIKKNVSLFAIICHKPSCQTRPKSFVKYMKL